MSNQIKIKNKRASFEYYLVERLVAGIQLNGTEIKSIRTGKVSLADAYCQFVEGELFVKEMHIAEYAMAAKDLVQRFNINEKGLAKLEIALARGKHFYDKRDSLKKKDIQREIDRGIKY